MKVTDFLNKKVVDRNANDIGKVSDLIIEPEEAVINGIVISTGEFSLRKTDLYIKPPEIEEVGDYVLLKLKRSEIKSFKEPDEEE